MSLQDEVTAAIKPGDDFYKYVNQNWQAQNPIPDDKASISAFSVLNDANIERLKVLLQQPTTGDDAINLQRLKTFYAAAVDTTTIEADGLQPVAAIITQITAITDVESLQQFITDCHASGRSMVWRAMIDIDNKDSHQYTALLSQSGLGLPSRDYYFETTDKFETTRQAYKKFLAQLFELLGKDNVMARASNVFSLEKALAEISKSPIEMRDLEATYNSFSLEKIVTKFPGFNWEHYLQETGFVASKQIIVSNPAFITGALALMQDCSIEQWQDYLLVRSLAPLLPALPDTYAQLHFSFYGSVLSGTKVLAPRYRRMISLATGLLPEPTGQLFVEAHFDETAKAAIEDLVEHIKAALATRIAALEWMSDATKQKAYQKLGTFVSLLGYPEQWRDYSALQLSANHAQNMLSITAFEHQTDIERLDGPVDRREWFMSPALVNAQYSPNLNTITFPAAILQPPFFDATGDFAVNYGAIGVVIGHEISHGFDDQGAQFDADGNMKSWWTKADETAFKARTKQLKNQYDGYEIDGQHVQGSLTLGENIGDLGGMLIAYDALQAVIAETGTAAAIDGFTPQQRFFMAEARAWRANDRPEAVHRQIMSDPHSPDFLRVNGVVTNIDAFYEAFNVQSEQKLYKAPKDRIRIW